MSTYASRLGDSKEILKRLTAWWYQSHLRPLGEPSHHEEYRTVLYSELEESRRELEKSYADHDKTHNVLRTVLESLDAGALVLGRDLSITLANHQFHDLLGDLDEAQVLQVLGERLVRSLKQGERYLLPHECKRVVRKADGMATPVRITVRECLDSANHNIGYLLVFQDGRRLTRIEAEAGRSRRLAALGEMAVGITHEVRNPLGGIELYASLIADQHEGEAKRLANEILQAVHRLQTTISHLLSFAAEPRITAEVVSVPLLLHEVRAAVFSLLHQGKWSLTTEVEHDLPLLWGDRALLVQALINLVVNAAEAMPQGGIVRLWARRTELSSIAHTSAQEVLICVDDDGPGIPLEDRERIFDPFFTTKPAGTGLGLALTHRIIQAHCGSIEVSSPGVRGSRLTVFLPIAGEHASG